jgi:2-methylcitrate dehydratase
MFDQPLEVDWENPQLEVVHQTIMKKYCSLIHGQPVLEATLALKRKHGLTSHDVDEVQCDIFQTGFDIAGGGSFGPKDNPQTKEQADYNLKYLIAAALLDDQVGPAQLEPERVRDPNAQALLKKVTVKPDAEFSAQYPRALNTRVTIRCKDGRVLVAEHVGFEGGLDNPFTWERTVEKFNWLSEQYADQALRDQIIDLVSTLDQHPIEELMNLLVKVSPEPRFLATHPGIQ